MSTTTTTTTNIPTTATATNPETALSYAALLLHDANTQVTPQKLQTLLQAAGITDIAPIWSTLFAKALADKDIASLLTTVSTSAPEVGRQQVIEDGKEEGGEEEGEQIVDGGEDGDGSDMEGGMFDLFG
jgi:large subunit ribosomal protein LP1